VTPDGVKLAAQAEAADAGTAVGNGAGGTAVPARLPPLRPRAIPPAPAPLQPLDDAAKQARLDRMKRRATGLLVVAAVVWVVARVFEARYPWLGLVRATAEAAMIGGLADWFAVTALFRHPMGIPIPHTAIIPARKDNVGRSLGGFVQRNFLTRDVIAGKLETLRMAETMARWVSEAENSQRIARHAAAGLAAAAVMLRDEDVQAMIDRSIAARVHATRVAPLLSKVLALITAGDRHQELLDEAIKVVARAVTDNRAFIRQRIEAETPWWVPGIVEDQIHRRLVESIERTLQEVRDDPNHPLRARFDTALRDFIHKLDSSPDVIERAEALKQELLSAEVMRRFSSSLWDDAKQALLRYAEDPEGRTPSAIERGLTAIGQAALDDPALLAKVDRWAVDVAVYLVDRYQDEVGQLISQTVSAWDPYATSRRIELAIGKDLQFIRINGTIVGGLAGAGIYLISKLF
jgi:uncharacterized membrane-anchored protein YjiN (DUF445 family)